ncbi:MAG TPA: DNA gyrase/topoisomerase IV subunit A, partial [Candidatus Sphingobacterium stercorigallinarum]|nr:DNA gyrase/topoisomerase IV subunit A [Candidatus Sphingobacterium stercorigallinarum]
GKSQTPEHLEQPLNEIVDVKGIKAQGNRLSFHAVEQVELLTSELDLSELEEPTAAVAQEKSSKNKPEESTDEISLEITNPNDIQLDQNGQLGLFGKKDDNN